MFTYSLDEIPFSRAGSWLTIAARNTSGSPRLLYATCSRRPAAHDEQPAHAFFEIALVRDGRELPYAWTAQPHRLDLQAEGGAATLVFQADDTLLFETQGAGLRLLPAKGFAIAHRPAPDQALLHDFAARGVHQFRAGAGTELSLEPAPTVQGLAQRPAGAPYAVAFQGAGGARGAVRFSPIEAHWLEPLPAIAPTLAARAAEVAAWMARMPAVPERYRAAAAQAWFVLWSCQAPAEGRLTRPAIYMSKFWMNAVWAWDNCFNALAVARAAPDLAWNQLHLFFDHQAPTGVLPDQISDLEAIYTFVKPPIYGWTIRRLTERLGLAAARPHLAALYPPVARLTDWWYAFRDSDGDGMCDYLHGNDSGWDNATVFDQGYPTEGADLAAHLALQCEALSWMAATLDKPAEAQAWQARAERQRAALLEHSVRDGRFVAPRSGSHTVAPSQSLLNCMPIMLGQLLPAALRRQLIADLGPGGPFLTDYGLATEAPASPHYQADGYWRGPIWAPSTYLIFDGLLAAGATDLARTVAESFCAMADREPGFWENYDALSGKGLRCPGYSWTAAGFLLLAEWLAADEAGDRHV